MSPPVDLVQSDPYLPTHAGVVVIGGGIVGVSTALFLAEQGHAVVLCEKGRIGGEQSSRNWGWCHTMGRKAGEIPLAMESLRLWRGLNERINRDTGYRQPGIVYLCETDAEVARQKAWLDQARQYQVDAHLLRGSQLDGVIPGASMGFVDQQGLWNITKSRLVRSRGDARCDQGREGSTLSGHSEGRVRAGVVLRSPNQMPPRSATPSISETCHLEN